jgi:hypothetical protein
VITFVEPGNASLEGRGVERQTGNSGLLKISEKSGGGIETSDVIVKDRNPDPSPCGIGKDSGQLSARCVIPDEVELQTYGLFCFAEGGKQGGKELPAIGEEFYQVPMCGSGFRTSSETPEESPGAG